MKPALILLSCLFSLNMLAQNIEAFVSQQLNNYPKSHLLDIYKSCFQDFMGAEHLVTDHEQVKKYLDEELTTSSSEELPSWYYEPCGTNGHFVRVSLKAVMDGRIAGDFLLDAFIRSANKKRPTVKSWRRQWNKMIKRIDRMNLNLPDYDKEKQIIDSLLTAGKYAVSHSPEYRDSYHPHYRIIQRRIFEREIKHKLIP